MSASDRAPAICAVAARRRRRPAFAMRQILLHIMPGDPGLRLALLGHHTHLGFIGFAVAIVLIALVLVFDRQFEADGAPIEAARSRAPRCGW